MEDETRRDLRRQINESMSKYNSLFKDEKAIYLGCEIGKKIFRSQIGPGIKAQSRNYNGIIYHTITIKPKVSVEYQWRFDCCRTIVQNTLRDPSVISGVVVNASFFRITEDYKPIGYYKTPSFSSDIKSDHSYLYGGICVKGNQLELVDAYAKTRNKIYDQVVTSGPVLLWPGKKPFTDETCETRDAENRYIYKCTHDVGDQYTQPCSSIVPGTLVHGCQRNPRSAIGEDVEGNIVLIYVEGRGQRGPGATFSEMAVLGQKLQLVKMINLDGGNSSQMMWKSEGDECICQLNPEHEFAYPVGATISFVKTM